MDDNQQETVLRSIAVSSGFVNISNPNDRQVAFQVLEDFKKYDGSIAVCIGWLHQERLGLDKTDITVPVKLYALTIIDAFLQTSYTKLGETERLQLRHAVLTSARHVAPAPIVNECRILGNKLASILAALMVRDFPQRWTTFFADVFAPMNRGGLWCNEPGDGVHTMGVKICLECLRLVTEDTTDSDFNAKVRAVACIMQLDTFLSCLSSTHLTDNLDTFTDIDFATKRCSAWSERSVLAVSATRVWNFGALHLSGTNENDAAQHENVLAVAG
jgi:hypothetical protein